MSIHPHSSNVTFFIFCVGQDVRKINAFKCSMNGLGIPFKPLIGRYKGQSEISFLAMMDNYNDIEPWLNEEESILHIHNFDSRDRPDATLLFLKDGRKVELGKMVCVSQEEALTRDSFTYDINYNNYFITER